MNLRHIDPRSTDWMDAMLEGEMNKGRQRPLKQEAADSGHEPDAAVLAAGVRTAGAPLATSPPPGSR